jgi:DNA-binding transcriptional MerR regulator
MENALPAIPAKRYFTIGEVSVLCGVKPYVLRYWEQEFTQLRPVKRRGNRRYYQHHEVLLIRRIRELLYDQGFTISGARNRLAEQVPAGRTGRTNGEAVSATSRASEGAADQAMADAADVAVDVAPDDELPLPEVSEFNEVDLAHLRIELLSIRNLLAE